MPERVRRAADAVVAVGLAIVLCANALSDRHLTPKPALVAFGLALTVPLIWRRHYPASVAIVCSTAYALLNGFSTGPYPPDLEVLPVMLAVFSGATYTRGRLAVLVGITTFAAIEIGWLLTPQGSIGQFLPWVLWGGPFGVGRLTRRRDATVSELTLRAELLEEKRAAAEREATRRERDRIARELHDVIAHAVSVMVVQAGAERLALGASGTDAVRTTTALERVERAGREALAELRAMLGVLRASPDDEPDGPAHPHPRLDSVPDLVDRLVEEGVDVRLQIVGAPQATHDAASPPAYRIVQEALTNAVKHGRAGPISVTVTYADDAIRLEVTNPCPPEPAAGDPGYGLVGARERAASLGGEMRAGREGDVWVMAVTLPCAPISVGIRA